MFIDTLPLVEASSAAAARVTDFAVVPCGPSVLDIESIRHYGGCCFNRRIEEVLSLEFANKIIAG